MPNLSEITHMAVYSKVAAEPMVKRYGDQVLIFINGAPMTKRSFYPLISKALLNESLKIPPLTWLQIHAETRALCQGMDIEMSKGREGFALIKLIRGAVNWTKDNSGYDRIAEVATWVSELEKKIKDAEEDLSPDQLPRG